MVLRETVLERKRACLTNCVCRVKGILCYFVMGKVTLHDLSTSDKLTNWTIIHHVGFAKGVVTAIILFDK